MVPDLRILEERIESALEHLIHIDPNALDASEVCELFAEHDIALVPMEQAET